MSHRLTEAQMGMEMGQVLHQSKVVTRLGMTLTTTLCGRMNSASKDGMNIAPTTGTVTCKFCLRAMLKPVTA